MRSIFIVEDHSMTALGLVTWFTGTGRWTIAGTAASVGEAKCQLSETKLRNVPDIILLDLQLAGESGLAFIAWLHKQELLQNIPIAVYSYFNDSAHQNAALRLGAAAYICKSQNNDELEQTLISTIENDAEDAVPSGPPHHEGGMEAAHVEKTVFDRLTRRETEIFLLLRDGHTSTYIARTLRINRRTVENHLSGIYDKTNLRKKDIAGL
jgi:DNA-binding NarL/FixJ family response regulator